MPTEATPLLEGQGSRAADERDDRSISTTSTEERVELFAELPWNRAPPPTYLQFCLVNYLVQFPLSLAFLGVLLGVAWVTDRYPEPGPRPTEIVMGAGGWLACKGASAVAADFGDTSQDIVLFFSRTLPSFLRRQRGVPSAARVEYCATKREERYSEAIETCVHVVVQEALRLGAVDIAVRLLPDAVPWDGTGVPPLDTLFFSGLWIAFGWAALEILAANLTFARRLSLYKNVLPYAEPDLFEEQAEDAAEAFTDQIAETDEDEDTDESESEDERNGNGAGLKTPGDLERGVTDSPQEADLTEEELARREDEDELLAFETKKMDLEREAILEALGLELYDIPVAVSLIWRLDSILLALDLSLLLCLPYRTTEPPLFPFSIPVAFVCAVIAHAAISLIWVFATRSLGVHVISYLTLILLVGGLFFVSAAWGLVE